MSTFIYRRASSNSARELSRAVTNGLRWRRDTRRTPVAGDTVVCWGEVAPQVAPGVLVINGAAIRNKFEDAQTLRQAGVATIEVSRTRPTAIAAVPATDPAIAIWETAQDLAEDFVEIEWAGRNPVTLRGIQELVTAFGNLSTVLNRPLPTASPRDTGEWVGRMFSHVGGDDLLAPPATPDYYSRKLTFTQEYRVHSFDGRSIRAGRKVLRDGYSTTPGAAGTLRASSWIRSLDGGWRINYDGFESTRVMRELAASAVNALGLNFGAVDLGQLADGTFVVLEVNRAPGLEGGSVESYGAAVNRFITEHPAGAARTATRRAA
jgi:hypothetical protein